jgi:hypothetical protein
MQGIIKQLPFRIDRDGHSFADAICLPEEEFDKLTEQDIERIKEERFSNWLTVINTPQPEVPIEKQLVDVEAQIASLDEQKEMLLKNRVELTAKVEAIALEELPVKEVVKPLK